MDFGAPITVIWGANSEGKTSLAEAMEFLFTGHIARRQLLASAIDEFENSLRNAHLEPGKSTFVEATIETPSKTLVTLRRTLIDDFTKRKPCTSKLELDGTPITQQSLEAIGLDISESPLGTPVLMQHTLGYLFSVNPKERATYFKSVLEVTDLDAARDCIRELDREIAHPTATYLGQLEITKDAQPSIRPEITKIAPDNLSYWNIPTSENIASAISLAVGKLLTTDGHTPEPELQERLNQFEQTVAMKQAKTFPIQGFNRTVQVIEWSKPDSLAWKSIEKLMDKLSHLDHETNRLTSIFEQVLKLPSVTDSQGDIDCPVCNTSDGLTRARIQKLRDHLQDNQEFRTVERNAKEALRSLLASATNLEQSTKSACPEFFTWNRDKRIREGFRTQRIAQLLELSLQPMLKPWFKATTRFLTRRRRLLRDITGTTRIIEELLLDVTKLTKDVPLKEMWNTLEKAYQELVTAISDYGLAMEPLTQPLKESVSEKSQTSGCLELVSAGKHIPELRSEFLDVAARAMLTEKLHQACKEVETAKDVVLEGKFDDLATEVRDWWNWMRPDEAAFFSDLGLRKNSQRTIDFTAGLAPATDRRNPKLRNAIAVFSQSQMHCLGLATFFSRRGNEGTFMVLDDPIISIDDDYSVHFITGVLHELVRRGVQVIILTHNRKTWSEIQTRYDNGRSEAFQLHLNKPTEGTMIIKSSDTLTAMLKAAEPFTTSSMLEHRKDGCKRIRDCAERFCKSVLVKHRQSQGETTAMIADYTGKNATLGSLIPQVTPYLEPDEPGKLRAIADGSNPGNHDDDFPGKAAIRVYLGDLKKLKKQHLS